MSTTSLNFSSIVAKRLACSFATLFAVALVLLLPQTQHALPPAVRPANAVQALLRPAALMLPGSHDFWHTEGNRILDARNHPVRISGMNWSGFETREAVPGGLEVQDYRAILRTIKADGYNTVRIPFSNEMIEDPIVPEHVHFSGPAGPINADLRDLTSIEILDKIVAYSGKIGLKIILDNHRSEAGSSAEESGLWYTSRFPESAWIEDWTALARRYGNTSTVIGMDLRNEPHNADKGGACWDCGGARDWHRAAQRAGNSILAINPRLLIFVEGVDAYAGDTYWWGGNLEGVQRSPVRLSVPNRLVYSAHEYGPSEYAQPWFNASTSASSLAFTWRRHWAYISEAGIAPVFIGEFGAPNDDLDIQNTTPGSEGQWFGQLVAFLAGHPALSWTYWGVNGEDRYGLLDATYSRETNALKAEALARISSGSASPTRVQAVATAPLEPATLPAVPTAFSQPALANMAPTQSLPTQSAPTQAAQPVDFETRPTHTQIPIRARSLQVTAPKLTRPAKRTTASSPDSTIQSAIAASIHSAVSAADQSLLDKAEVSSR